LESEFAPEGGDKFEQMKQAYEEQEIRLKEEAEQAK